jgi:hypothetical protein
MGMHGSCDQPGGWGLCPRGGASSRGGSDSPVQVELFQGALMPGSCANIRLIETSGRRCGPGRDGSEPGSQR